MFTKLNFCPDININYNRYFHSFSKIKNQKLTLSMHYIKTSLKKVTTLNNQSKIFSI